MVWKVALHGEFEVEFDKFPKSVQEAIMVKAMLLKTVGPSLKRPHADTLNGSSHENMKELRCNADSGVWRIAFAFDSERKAILPAAGNKSGVSEKRFYRKLIAKADSRFDQHLAV